MMGPRHVFSSGGVGGVPPPYPPPRKKSQKKSEKKKWGLRPSFSVQFVVDVGDVFVPARPTGEALVALTWRWTIEA